jgi:predicted nuclease of restriction endonuclease-like (RecB) superfamily
VAKKKPPPKSPLPAKRTATPVGTGNDHGYDGLLSGLSNLLEDARRGAARTVNAILTATYWEFGRRIVEFEQGGKIRAGYGESLLQRLADDLTATHGRGFGWRNLFSMRAFYLGWELRIFDDGKSQFRARLLEESGKLQTPSAISSPLDLEAVTTEWFPLPWSHYVRLLSVENPHAQQFYEEEAIRGGWSVRQLNRQVNSMFFERTALSRNKAAMLTKGQMPKPEDMVTPEEQIRDPLVLEFLNLKNEYAESDLEEALIHHLEEFLLELGGDFTFVGRQRRLRLDDKWFKVDLLFFHRRLRSLIIIDLKIGEFSHADAGQMNMYLNYAKEHWVREGENPPVGLILCAQKGHDEARYALEGLGNKVLTTTYRTTLPEEKVLIAEIERTRRMLENKSATEGEKPKGGK